MTEFVSRDEYTKLLNDVKKLQRQMKKLIKQKKETDPAEKKVSGFAKPTNVSSELAAFLGLEKDELIARTEVTKRINKYVKEHGLQDEANKRIILLNDELKKLVNPPDDVQLTFFNLQRYLKHHYTVQKESEPETSSSSEPDSPPPSPEQDTAVDKSKKVKKVKKNKQ